MDGPGVTTDELQRAGARTVLAEASGHVPLVRKLNDGMGSANPAGFGVEARTREW